MKIKLDHKTIQLIDLFHTLTGSNVVDCLNEDECIYFVVAEGQYGLAVGRNGSKIRNAERVFKKQICVFEYSSEMKKFIQNILPEVQEITKSEDGKIIFVKVRQSDKPKVIGKSGKNIKLIKKFLQRLFDVEELKVR